MQTSDKMDNSSKATATATATLYVSQAFLQELSGSYNQPTFDEAFVVGSGSARGRMHDLDCSKYVCGPLPGYETPRIVSFVRRTTSLQEPSSHVQESRRLERKLVLWALDCVPLTPTYPKSA